MQDCIVLMRQTLIDYTQKNAVQMLRTAMKVEEGKILGVMPAAYLPLGVAGTKVITVFPGNFKRGLPSHQGAVVLFDTETGALRAVVDGEAVTGVRTAAVKRGGPTCLPARMPKCIAQHAHSVFTCDANKLKQKNNQSGPEFRGRFGLGIEIIW